MLSRLHGFTRLAHLADIHIQDARREEYAAVFTPLYAGLREWCGRRDESRSEAGSEGIGEHAKTLIVVAGDVFDIKTSASALNIQDVIDFLRELSSIAPVILIGGNHEMSQKHPGSLDLLSAVLKVSGLKNLRYVRSSGFSFLHNIVWGVLATDDKTLRTPEDRDLWLSGQPVAAQEAPSICLFHEEVNTAKWCNGSEIPKYRLELFARLFAQKMHQLVWSLAARLHTQKMQLLFYSLVARLFAQKMHEFVWSRC